MTVRKKIMAGFLSLLLCLGLCGLIPIEASAEGEIGKVLTTLSNVPVAMDGVYSITAATSTEGCYLTSYGWFDSSGSLGGLLGADIVQGGVQAAQLPEQRVQLRRELLALLPQPVGLLAEIGENLTAAVDHVHLVDLVAGIGGNLRCRIANGLHALHPDALEALRIFCHSVSLLYLHDSMLIAL